MIKLYFPIMLLIFSFPLYAQSFFVGLELGASSSMETDFGFHRLESVEQIERRNALFAGVNLSYHFSENLSLETGISYLGQGLKHKTCNEFYEGVDDWYYTNRDYLVIPLSVDIGLQNESQVKAILGLFVTKNFHSSLESPNFREERSGGCGILFKNDIYPNTYKNYLGGIAGFKFKLLNTKNWNINLLAKFYQSLGLISRNRRSNSILLTLNFDWQA